LEEIHQVADGENDHRHEEEGSARFHDREQSAEQYANKTKLCSTWRSWRKRGQIVRFRIS
jgi:hypothetical protein